MSVHPHMRGEYFNAPFALCLNLGSSPHAWRILPRTPCEWLNDRFIPTCVENMNVAPEILDAGSVHPHMRGEYSIP